MPEFKSVKDLMAHIEKQVNEVLTNEVATKVKEVMQEHVQEDVYNAYQPKMYQRREHDGGLIDIDQIMSSVVNGELTIRNMAFDGDKDVPMIVETGVGYTFPGEFTKPRPFTARTRDDLEGNKQHVQALKDGLGKKGMKFG